MTFQFSFRLVAKSNFDLLLRKWAPKTTKFKAPKNVKFHSKRILCVPKIEKLSSLNKEKNIKLISVKNWYKELEKFGIIK